MVIIFEIYDEWDMLSWWPNNSAYYLYNHPILNACTLTPIYGGVVDMA